MKMLRILPAALAILFLSSCNKLVDHIKDHLDDDDKDKKYRIEKWVRYRQGQDSAVGIFTYNTYNDPVSVIFDSLQTGGPHWLFKYDKHKRLSESYQYPGGGYLDPLYEEYKKYKYNNAGQIVSDTTYSWGFWNTIPTPQNTYYWESFYTYDSKGRIIKIVINYPYISPEDPATTTTTTFTYDANGNLVRPGFVYDNKKNFMTTNKIWMFVSRDYSANNPIPAVNYNNGGLPLAFNYELTQPWSGPLFLANTFNRSTFTYKKIK